MQQAGLDKKNEINNFLTKTGERARKLFIWALSLFV
jgi:hypothetical protein